MEQAIFAISGVLIGALFVWLLSQKRSKAPEDKSFLMLQDQINNLTSKIDDRLDKTQAQMRDSVSRQFTESSKIIKDVTERLTKLDETNKQVINVTDQLQSLQDILKNPKQRGVLGEYYLETVLKNVLPPERFALQHNLGKGEDGKSLVVDAVIYLDKNKILPIDSKFSLENYN